MPGMKQRVKDGVCLFLVRHSRFFDAEWYRAQAGLPADADAAAHYYRGGWRTQDPSRRFPQENYLAARRDVREAEVCPLAHWLLYGRGKAFPGLETARYSRRPVIRGIRRGIGRLRYAGTIRRNRGTRILAAVILPDEAARGEIDEYLKNLGPYDVDTAVTESCRGREAADWLETIRSRNMNAYDIVLTICPAGERKLFAAGTEAVCGAGRVHENIDRLTRGETEIAVSGKTIRQDPPFRETMVNRALGKAGLTLKPGYRYDGSGIWMTRAETAAETAQADVRTEEMDPQMARAMERYLTGRLLPAGERADAAPAGAGGVIAFAVTETGSGAVAGDSFTALELAGALEKRGRKTKMLARNEGDWYTVGEETDVVVSMLEDYDPGQIRDGKPGLVTVAWARNWFEKWAVSPAIADYAILLASSEGARRELAAKTGRQAELFPIAANAERFREAPETAADEAYRCDVCFTGNRFSPREIETQLVPAELPYDIRIWGDGWSEVKGFAECCKGHLPYEEIPKVYRGAKIALDDATASTRETGSVNSRVFDALAAGCLVLTNNRKGAEETFGGLLPVFGSREELEGLLKLYLEDGEARKAKVAELRAFVLEKHTYEIRAEKLEALLSEYLAGERTGGEDPSLRSG